MAKCDACGNDYDKSFQVVMGGESHNFDSYHGAVCFQREMVNVSDGKVISVGLEMLLLAPDGRIREDYQFIEPSA